MKAGDVEKVKWISLLFAFIFLSFLYVRSFSGYYFFFLRYLFICTLKSHVFLFTLLIFISVNVWKWVFIAFTPKYRFEESYVVINRLAKMNKKNRTILTRYGKKMYETKTTTSKKSIKSCSKCVSVNRNDSSFVLVTIQVAKKKWENKLNHLKRTINFSLVL